MCVLRGGRGRSGRICEGRGDGGGGIRVGVELEMQWFFNVLF